MKKNKTLPKWLTDEMRLLGWKTAESGVQKGFAWIKDGILLHIVPSANQPKMYHVTKEKMSERDVMFLHEPMLLQLIEGDSDD